MEEIEGATAENADTLLELSSALAIARSAVEDRIARWALDAACSSARRITSYADIQLRRHDGLICRISKGRPLDLLRYEVPNWRQPLANEMGLPARGGEPDHVFTFWREQSPERCVTCLGDAKRNATGDGAAYLAVALNRVLAYGLEYAPSLGLACATPDGTRGLSATLLPFVTIFAWQGVNRVAGVDATDTAAVTRRLGGGDALPAVLALDAEKHFRAPVTPGGSGGGPSPVLTAWFRRLTTQAERALDGKPVRFGP